MQARAPRLFVHFFDVHFLEEKAASAFPDKVLAEAKLAFRLALLLADEVLVLASSLIESPLCQDVLAEYGDEMFSTHISLVASGTNYGEFIEDKLLQYGEQDSHGQLYRKAASAPAFPWLNRRRSATRDIASNWAVDVQAGRFEALLRRLDERPANIERRLEEASARLEGRAFIAPNIMPILFGKERSASLSARNYVLTVINRGYFGSYATDPEAAIIRNLGWLGSEGVVSRLPAYDVDYRRTVESLRKHGVLGLVAGAPASTLLAIRDDERFIQAVAEARGEGGRENALKGYYGCCQSNGNLSPVGRSSPKPERRLSRDCAPLSQCG